MTIQKPPPAASSFMMKKIPVSLEKTHCCSSCGFEVRPVVTGDWFLGMFSRISEVYHFFTGASHLKAVANHWRENE
jgi:hypothetical protein